MRVKLAVAILLWSAAVAAADEVPGNLRLMEGGTAYRIGDRDIAVGGLEAALAAAEAAAPDSPRVAALLNILGDRQRGDSRFAEAALLYHRALAMFQRTMGAWHPNVATVSLNLASAYVAQNRSADAAQHYERALGIFEQVLSPEHSYVTTTVDALAALYRERGRTADLERLCQRALASAQRALGPKHPRALALQYQLVGLYQLQGRFSAAEPLARQILATLEQVAGPGHPSTGLAMSKLAGIYQARGLYRESELLYQRALAILEADESAHIEIFNGMITLYEAQGRHADVQALTERLQATRDSGVRQLGYGPVVIRQSHSSAPVRAGAR